MGGEYLPTTAKLLRLTRDLIVAGVDKSQLTSNCPHSLES